LSPRAGRNGTRHRRRSTFDPKIAFTPGAIGYLAAVAFPRLNALSYWLFTFGGLIVTAGFIVPGDAADFGWTGYTPLTELPRIRSERPSFELHYPHMRERMRNEPLRRPPPPQEQR
jgi:hypothetical protein